MSSDQPALVAIRPKLEGTMELLMSRAKTFFRVRFCWYWLRLPATSLPACARMDPVVSLRYE